MPATFADGMLGRAYRSLDKAAQAKTPNAIYVAAFMAASHAAAAAVAAKISPEQRARMSNPGSLWKALAIAAPDLKGWADYFEANARRRNLADKGMANAISLDQAETMLRDVTDFLATAEGIVQKEAAS